MEDHEVAGLIERIRTLVAEQRRLEANADGERLEEHGREIDRLQTRLVLAVRRELARLPSSETD
jgi:hypothetical protein